jgi:hypothetical protein
MEKWLSADFGHADFGRMDGFDIEQRDSRRITLKAEQVCEAGFQAVVSTWASTRVYAVEFNWLAIGA